METNESFNPSPDALAILNQDLSAVSTALPVLKAGIYNLRVADIAFVAANTPGKTNIKVKLVTTEPATATSGDPVNVGYPLFNYFSIDPTEKFTKEMIERNLKTFRVACLGAEGETGQFMPHSQYIDRIVQANVEANGERVDKVTGKTYSPSNSIKNFVTKPK